MISSKKAQGMSINVIIIAALAIAVLVVLFAVFTGRISLVSKQLDSCSNLGGTCSLNDKCNDGSGLTNPEDYTQYSTTKKFSDCADNKACCILIKK